MGSGDQNLTVQQKRIKKSLWFFSISRNAIIVLISAVLAYYFETAGPSPFILSGMLKQGLWIHSVWSSVHFCDDYYKWYIQKTLFTFTLYASRWKRKHSVTTSVNYNLFHVTSTSSGMWCVRIEYHFPLQRNPVPSSLEFSGPRKISTFQITKPTNQRADDRDLLEAHVNVSWFVY